MQHIVVEKKQPAAANKDFGECVPSLHAVDVHVDVVSWQVYAAHLGAAAFFRAVLLLLLSCSKRRMPVQVAEVAQQLQQLPLGGTSPQQHHIAMAAAASSDRPRAGHHAVKRYKVAGHPPAPGAAPVKAAAPLGFRSPQQHHPAAAGGQREPPCELFEELMAQASPLQGGSQRTACGLHPMAKSMSAGCGRPAGWGVHSQQQQQQCMMMQQLNNMGGGWSEMAAPVMQHGRQEALRCSSVNALMQATVSDTLWGHPYT